MVLPIDGRSQDPPPDAALDELSAEGRRLVASISHKLFETHDVATRLGRYVLLDVVGRGGMGVIYRAYDPELDRRVAIKVLSTRTEAAHERLKLEAKALARLAHPNVVTVHEVGEDRGEVWVALELVDGGTLAAWSEKHPDATAARQRRALALAHQAVEGLVAAHALGLVHRDIKPQNLLVGSAGRLRIADFGLARSAGATQDSGEGEDDSPRADTASLRGTDSVGGTPVYMPPEQFEGHADERSDQFSFCAAFFETLYGERPFAATNQLQRMAEIERGRIVSTRGRHVPDYVRRVLTRGLAARPADRFPSMRALGNALRSGARRRAFAGYGGGLVALLSAGAALVYQGRPEACTDERATIEDAAGPNARAAVQAALETIDLPFAAGVWTRTSMELDGLVDDWAEQRLAACRLARDQDPERARTGELQLRCLDDAVPTVREALAIESLSAQDAALFPNYVEVVLDAADCRAPSAELYRVEAGRAALAALRAAQLADKRGELATARTGYEAVLTATAPDQLPRLRAEAHQGLAQLAGTSNDAEALRRHRLAGLAEAERSGDPDLIVGGWIGVADLVTPAAGWDTVELFIARAQSVAANGPVSRRMQSKLLLLQGQLHEKFGHSQESADLYKQILARDDEFDPVTLMFAHHSLSYAMTLLSRGDEAIEHGRASYARALEYYGPHHDVTNGFGYQLALGYQWNGDAAQAESTIDATLTAYEATPEFNVHNRVLATYLRGTLRMDRGATALGRADYQRGLEILAEHGVTCSDLTGTGEMAIARTQMESGDHEGALKAIERALPCMTGTASYDRASRSEAALTRAAILAELGRPDESREALVEGRELAANAFADDTAWNAAAAVRVVEVLLALGDKAEARREIAAARRELSEDDAESEATLRRLEVEAEAP
ncbi:MAG: serine/threonine-protein kinase [Myxococcota bacterium]